MNPLYTYCSVQHIHCFLRKCVGRRVCTKCRGWVRDTRVGEKMIWPFLPFPPPSMFVYCPQANTTSVHVMVVIISRGAFGLISWGPDLKWYNYKGHTQINFHRFRNWPERYLETCLPNVVIRIPNVENPASPYTGCDGVLNIWYVFKGPSHNAFGISNFSRT